jgi:hypothetical protein
MPSPRRSFLSRIGVHRTHHSTRAPRYVPLVVDRFDLGIGEDDGYLPPYNRITDPYNRPPSPTPTYHTFDERRRPRHNVSNIVAHKAAQISMYHQQLIDELVIRLRENLKNPNSWRLNKVGKRSFFWALKCSEGTADILSENMDEIKDRVLVDRNWTVEKFCLIFKGQKLEDLWCRPVVTEVSFFCDLS